MITIESQEKYAEYDTLATQEQILDALSRQTPGTLNHFVLSLFQRTNALPEEPIRAQYEGFAFAKRTTVTLGHARKVTNSMIGRYGLRISRTETPDGIVWRVLCKDKEPKVDGDKTLTDRTAENVRKTMGGGETAAEIAATILSLRTMVEVNKSKEENP